MIQNVALFEDKYTEALLKQQQRLHRQTSARAAPSRRSGRSGAASPADGSVEATSDLDSHVASGYIFNPISNRNIKIGGDTYIRLVEAGWRPDIVHGTMKAPAPEVDAMAVKGVKGSKKT